MWRQYSGQDESIQTVRLDGLRASRLFLLYVPCLHSWGSFGMRREQGSSLQALCCERFFLMQRWKLSCNRSRASFGIPGSLLKHGPMGLLRLGALAELRVDVRVRARSSPLLRNSLGGSLSDHRRHPCRQGNSQRAFGTVPKSLKPYTRYRKSVAVPRCWRRASWPAMRRSFQARCQDANGTTDPRKLRDCKSKRESKSYILHPKHLNSKTPKSKSFKP